MTSTPNRSGERPAKRHKPDYTNNLLTISVGPEEKKFVVHKATLCQKSSYFDRTCARDWKENQENLVRLRDADAGAFAAYAHWAYSGQVDDSLCSDPGSDERASPFSNPLPLNLGKIYVLADYLGDRVLCNRAINVLLTDICWEPQVKIDAAAMAYIFERAPEGCALRRLIVDIMVTRVDKDHFEKHGKAYPAELMWELARRFVSGEVKRPPAATYEQRCNYHVHEDGEASCR